MNSDLLEKILLNCRLIWFLLFAGCVGYGYLLYTPVLDDWYYHPVIHDIEKTDFFVKDLPFPAITICSNNKIVRRQLENVLLTQPWKGYNKSIYNFSKDLETALTALVIAEDNPQMLSKLNPGAVSILNHHKDALPEIMKKVNRYYI